MPSTPTTRLSDQESTPVTTRSCKECRRRKLRCDRKVPCSSCVSRGLDDLCPDGIVNTKTVQLRAEVDRLQQRIQDLENRLGHGSTHGQPAQNPSTSVIISPSSALSYPDHPDDIPVASPSAQTRYDEQWTPAPGTLMVDKSGRTRYVGSTAASEWLNQGPEASHMTETIRPQSSQLSSMNQLANFPFRNIPSNVYPFLHSLLPPQDRIEVLLDSYWYLYAFNYNVVSRHTLELYLDNIYNMDPSQEWTQDTHPHKLALIFIVLAMGSLVNPDSNSNHNGESQTLFEAAEVALSISNFMKDHTIASVQTLHIMANFHVYDDRSRGGDRAWPLGGLAMRITQAMGLHRDGTKWGLPEYITEERRRLFWEIHTEETFQAHCFGRPGGLSSRHFDVGCPKDDSSLPFSTIRYQLVRISSDVLDQVMVVDPPSYSVILHFHGQFESLEKSLPDAVRWSPATSASPSAHLSWSSTPIAEKEAILIALRQHLLYLNINESILFLLRTHFARCLRENPDDPSKGRYHIAFNSVFARCQTIIAITRSLYTLHPRIALVHWFFWYHACSAAVCMASIPMIAPLSPFALQGWHELQSACRLFSASGHQSKSSMSSLALLLRLRKSAFDKMSGDRAFTSDAFSHTANSKDFTETIDDREVDESSHLMGVHTRLIERRNMGPNRSDVQLQSPPAGMRSPVHPSNTDREPDTGWEPSFPTHLIPEAELPSFSFDIQPQTAESADPSSQTIRFDFDLDESSLAFLSSMRPDPDQLGPVPLDTQMNWNDLEFWLGVGADANGGSLPDPTSGSIAPQASRP
ncbi:hypothetical protein I302_108562 [Kwoniella bestiolae CBS 10118]|uniref:Zn(2)-C6 fungal-type domain-containing protein n=1 Tax=Kwoniella bestiolae CBS 10118 TaxID=1296100 RepID=A0A1B9FVD6_9TREE|nr:hypothetical protein I302_07065 [Kwoniella bestiolae CBS 10118]OCF22725.1 hypothetical protein I302_07065 [Kwoniella bestiolae CBS 10118]